MDSVNIKNFNTLKTMDKIFSIPPGPKHIVEAANYLYGTENEVGSKINETSAYNYFSGNGHDLTRILYSAYGIIQNDIFKTVKCQMSSAGDIFRAKVSLNTGFRATVRHGDLIATV